MNELRQKLGRRLHDRAHLRNVALLLAVGLTWFVFHTVPQDNININVALVFVLVFLASIPDRSSQIWVERRFVWYLIFGMVVLGGLTTAFVGGETANLRMWVLVSVVFVLGAIVGSTRDVRWVLGGLLLGSVLVLSYGWFLHLNNPLNSGSLLQGSFDGVSGLESYELLSVLTGFASLFSLLAAKPIFLGWLAPVFAFLAFSLIYLGLTVAFLSFFALVVTAVTIAVVKKLDSRKVEKFVLLGTASAAVLATASLLIRPLAGAIGDALGEPSSLRARFIIWDSVLESLGVSGLIFGHGTAFWAPDSPFAGVAHENMQSAGLPGFGHAHSMYVDFFVAFGIVGVLVAGVLAFLFLRETVGRWKISNQWVFYATPWLFFIMLAVLGVSVYSGNSTNRLVSRGHSYRVGSPVRGKQPWVDAGDTKREQKTCGSPFSLAPKK